MKNTKAVLLAVIGLLIAGCNGRQGDDHKGEKIHIDSAQYKRTWPFLVSEGTISCDKHRAIFTANDTKYPLNEAASAHLSSKLEEIWLFDSSYAEYEKLAALEKGMTLRKYYEKYGRVRMDIRYFTILAISICKRKDRDEESYFSH